MGLELKPEIITALATLAAAEGLSVEDYLKALVQKELPLQTKKIADTSKQDAAELILELQKHVKPDPDGWTVRDYINYGRH